MTTTKLYVTGRKPASVPLIQRFQIQMVTNDHTTELQIIRHYPAGDDSNNMTVWTSQMNRPQRRTRPIRRFRSNEQRGGCQPDSSHRGRVISRILYSTAKKTQYSIVSRKWHGLTWVMWYDHRWLSSRSDMTCKLRTVPHDHSKLFCSIIGPNFKMVRYGRDGLNNDSTNVRNEHFLKLSHFQS